MNTLLAYAFLVFTFTAAPLLFNYFLTVIQKNSTSIWGDLGYWLFFAGPLLVIHTLISQAWHRSRDLELSVWATSIIATVCGAVGTALALWLFFDEIPTWPKYVGFLLMLAGAVVATVVK